MNFHFGYLVYLLKSSSFSLISYSFSSLPYHFFSIYCSFSDASYFIMSGWSFSLRVCEVKKDPNSTPPQELTLLNNALILVSNKKKALLRLFPRQFIDLFLRSTAYLYFFLPPHSSLRIFVLQLAFIFTSCWLCYRISHFGN